MQRTLTRALLVPCPVCDAAEGMSCAVTRPRHIPGRGLDWSHVGELRAEPHARRLTAARKIRTR